MRLPWAFLGKVERGRIEEVVGRIDGEVAGKLGKRWIGSGGGRADALPETFVVEKPERAIFAVVELGNQHWSAYGRAEVVD